MLILKYNTHLSVQELFEVEHIMLKIADRKNPLYSDLLEWSVLEQPRPVIYGVLLGYAALLGVYQTLSVSPSEFFDFLVDVDHGYLPNHYHAFPHAADVALIVYHMLVEFEVGKVLSSIELASLFIAGLCHDLGHPGKNNNFQVNRETDLAIRYENLSVLESYSCTLTIELLEKHRLVKSTNMPMGVDKVLASIVKMILSTDMVFHYELQENLACLLDIDAERRRRPHAQHYCCSWCNSCCHQQQPVTPPSSSVSDLFAGEKSPLHLFFDPDPRCSPPVSEAAVRTSGPHGCCCCRHQRSQSNNSSSAVSSNIPTTDMTHMSVFTPQERQMLCQIVLHAADISNPLRVWELSKQWSGRVCQEFFCQAELEKQLGLPVSPNMDRHQISQTTIGLQFGDFIVSPFFEAFASLFPKASVLVKQLRQNRLELLHLQKEEEEEQQQGQLASIPIGMKTILDSPTLSSQHHPNHASTGDSESAITPPQTSGGGRRVSVAAGTIIISEEQLQRPGRIGTRSVSDTGGDGQFLLRNCGRTLNGKDAQPMERRRSEEPSLLCQMTRRLEQVPSSSPRQKRRVSSIRQGQLSDNQQKHQPIASPQ